MLSRPVGHMKNTFGLSIGKVMHRPTSSGDVNFVVQIALDQDFQSLLTSQAYLSVKCK
jgi:hypothetical protein